MISARSDILLRVKRLEAPSFIIPCRTSNTVLEIKEKITLKSGLYPYQQRLVYRGRVLNDEVSIGYYGITGNATIYLAPIKQNRSVRTKPEVMIAKLQDLCIKYQTNHKNDTKLEIKELINNTLIISLARIDINASNILAAARELIENDDESQQPDYIDEYVAKATDNAFNQIEASPEGLIVLQCLLNDAEAQLDDENEFDSEEEIIQDHMAYPQYQNPNVTNISYAPRISVAPLPPLKGTYSTQKRGPARRSFNGNATAISIITGLHHPKCDSLLERYAQQVAILKRMGFDDEIAILEVLGETGGNVQKAAQILSDRRVPHFF